jgi:hypothetical protein
MDGVEFGSHELLAPLSGRTDFAEQYSP